MRTRVYKIVSSFFLIPYMYGYFKLNDISNFNQACSPWNHLNTQAQSHTNQYDIDPCIEDGIKKSLIFARVCKF